MIIFTGGCVQFTQTLNPVSLLLLFNQPYALTCEPRPASCSALFMLARSSSSDEFAARSAGSSKFNYNPASTLQTCTHTYRPVIKEHETDFSFNVDRTSRKLLFVHRYLSDYNATRTGNMPLRPSTVEPKRRDQSFNSSPHRRTAARSATGRNYRWGGDGRRASPISLLASEMTLPSPHSNVRANTHTCARSTSRGVQQQPQRIKYVQTTQEEEEQKVQVCAATRSDTLKRDLRKRLFEAHSKM